MVLKLKTILLLFCLLDYVFLQSSNEQDIEPKGQVTFQEGSSSIFTVRKNQFLYSTYFDITLITKGKTCPIMCVSNDNKCQDRLFVGIQTNDHIRGFIKNNQIIQDRFYICTQFKNNEENSEYSIIVKNEESVYIPYNSQLSYYVTSNTKEVEFTFSSGDLDIGNEAVATFWIRGENINKDINMPDFKKTEFDHGYIFSGHLNGNDSDYHPTLIVSSIEGDYITIGSTIIKGRELSYEIKENQNEIMIASDKKVCFKLPNQGFSFLTGKIYTGKASVSFLTKNNQKITELGGEIIQTEIDDGIIAYLNPFPFQKEENREGYFCLEHSNFMIFSLQLTSNDNTDQVIYSPISPGEIQRHFLSIGKIGIFYGVKPINNAKEVNLNFKIIKGFPEMYYDKCKTFPDCTYYYEDPSKGS